MNIDTIRNFIKDEILNDADLQIEAEQDLLLSEILNSLSVTMLIAHLEDTCNVHIPPEDVTLEHFGTLQSIESYVRRRIDSSD
jgi:acyl carrier protein